MCYNLAITIKGLFSHFSLQSNRTEKNRCECFEMDLKQYYKDLEEWRKEKEKIIDLV